MLPIVKAPNDVLSSPANPVQKVDASILRLIEEMKKTLLVTHDPEGVGLAAPQVGKALQLFLTKPTPKSAFLVCVNPKIISVSETMQELGRPKRSKAPAKLEGCLSLVNIWGTLKRHATVTLSYLDERGKPHTKKFSGFLATIIQHEMDHLEGILFPKRVLEQQGKLYRSHKNKKGEDEFEEIVL
ncbi:MAG: peptide deformylase [Candidatus Levybacteria bacterium]|nr:peptide deformylase [Candidatus Levybacteria bacterium]